MKRNVMQAKMEMGTMNELDWARSLFSARSLFDAALKRGRDTKNRAMLIRAWHRYNRVVERWYFRVLEPDENNQRATEEVKP